jgi:hypothetical protein
MKPIRFTRYKKIAFWAFVWLVFLLLAASAAKADEVKPGTTFVSIYAGLYGGGGKAYGVGGSLEYAFTKRYGFQVEFNAMPLRHDPTFYGFIGSFVYNIPTDIEKTVPYFTGGVSFWTCAEGRGFPLNLGGGIKYELSDSLGLKFDLTVFTPRVNIFRLVGGLMWVF